MVRLQTGSLDRKHPMVSFRFYSLEGVLEKEGEKIKVGLWTSFPFLYAAGKYRTGTFVEVL